MIEENLKPWMEFNKSSCCCGSVADIIRFGAGICPYICPWLPFNSTAKVDENLTLHSKYDDDKIVETEEEFTQQKSDKSSYKYIMLKNGIKMLLIEDSTASTSACSLQIKVGNFSDPPHLPGLAHLLEHIIFTGSELFPAEGFSSFLSCRGGSNNAYTASSYTNFHFDIPKEHFLDALDRFVSFFICPVFHERTIEKEVEIIQCEHEKNKHSDVWRTNQVEKCTSNPKHPFSRFSTGTRTTLKVDPKSNRNLKYEVYTFFKRYYSANLMSVVVLHNSHIDKLEEIALNKFIHIPNKNIPQTIYRNPVFLPNQMALKLYIVPLKEIYHLNLTFPLGGFDDDYKSSPGTLVSHLLGHKGKGSIFSLLRREGLAHHVVAAHKKFDLTNFSFMLLTIQLTDKGERLVDSIISVVFQYLLMLQQNPLPKYFFDELSLISHHLFQMKDREKAVTTVENLAHAVHLYSPKDILSGDYLFSDWRPDLVQKILSDLTPANLRVTILSKNAKYLETKVEPHYGTEFHVDKIPDEVLSCWKNVSLHPQLSLPEPNHYVTKSVDSLKNVGKTRRQPELAINLERVRMRIWSSPDARFVLPKSYFYFKFSSPECYSSARNWNLTNLMVYNLKDNLVELTYPAQMAGLVHTLKPAKYGFELMVRGYTSSIINFLQDILNAIYSMEFTQEVFQTVLDVHKKGLLSCLAEPLKSQSRYLVNTLLSSKVWTREQRWENLNNININDVIVFYQKFLDSHGLECLFFGNIEKEQVDELSNLLLKRRADYLEERCQQLKLKVDSPPNLADWFKTDPVERIVLHEKALSKLNSSSDTGDMSPSRLLVERDLLLPTGSTTVTIHNEHHTMSMVILILQLDSTNLEKSCILEVFTHMVRERIISRLRNMVILGYVIGCDVRKINGSIGLRIMVESQLPPTAVNLAIEDCIQDIDGYIRSLNHADFKIHVNALKAAKTESHMKMLDYNAILWREIVEGTYDFRRNHRESEHLNFITLSKVKQFYSDCIQQGAPNRRKLLLSIAPDPTLNTIQEENNEVYSWEAREELKEKCESIPEIDQEELRQWFSAVFRSGDDGYQPPGEQPESPPHQPLSVHFQCPEIQRD